MGKNWYKKANEFLGVDATMSPSDINDTRNFKAEQMAPDTPQGLGGMVTDVRKQSEEVEGSCGKKVSRCGEEPGGGGCGRDFSDGGCKWKGYPVEIDGVKYESYECNFCKHGLNAFDIRYTKSPVVRRKDRRKKKRVRRLSQRMTLRTVEAATPAVPTPGGYNNPANQMQGRLDLSEDSRMIPWSSMEESYYKEYDEQGQKDNSKYKLIKIKGKDGKDRYVKVKKNSTGGEGVSPANTQNSRGERKKHPRYNPSTNVQKGNPGAWPHNRDDNEGSYNMYVDKNRMNSDMRERVIPWSQYITERGNGMGMLKPY